MALSNCLTVAAIATGLSCGEAGFRPQAEATMKREFVTESLRSTLSRVAADLTFCTERLDHDQFRTHNEKPTYQKEVVDAEREILRPLLDDGFKLVGCGIARCVLRPPTDSPYRDYVIKLSRFGVSPVSLGAVQNHREVLLWSRHGESGDWPLVPVVDYEPDRFSWLVMPYGEPISDLPERKQQENLDRVRSQLRFLPDFDMREVFESNIVLIDESPLIADYGLPEGV